MLLILQEVFNIDNCSVFIEVREPRIIGKAKNSYLLEIETSLSWLRALRREDLYIVVLTTTDTDIACSEVFTKKLDMIATSNL
jgi:predicted metal-dependent RNase